MPPAARVTDMHVCPMVTGVVPHVGGPILPPCAPTVLIGFLPAARVTDMLTCVGPPDIIVKGSAGVFINFLPAARMGDQTAHGGVIVLGLPTVMIGEIGAPSPGAGGLGGVIAGLVAAGMPVAAAANPSKYGSPAPPAAPPAVTIPAECAYLRKKDRVYGESSNFNANRRQATVGPTSNIRYTFPGGSGPVDATTHTVTIGGHSVKVIEPVGGPTAARQHVPSSAEITQSLGAVPAKQFDYIKTVVVSPQANPQNALWEQQYGIPGFQSEATGGADGTVTWYPINSDTPMIADETMIHESGHTYSQNIWRRDNDWKPWEDAIHADGRAASDYAEKSRGEDFSESLVMYRMSKGTPCEATAKALFPARYRILDNLLNPPLPPPRPAAGDR